MAAGDGIAAVLAHGGVGGAVVEVSVTVLIVAIALAAWVGGRREKDG